MKTESEIGHKIKDSIDTLTEFIVKKQIELQPHLSNYTPYQMRHFYNDTRYHLMYLSESLILREPILFEEYIKWGKVFFDHLKIPTEDITTNFFVIKDSLKILFTPDEYVHPHALLDKAIIIFNESETKFGSFITDDNPLKEVAIKYLDYLIVGNKTDAYNLIINTFESGVSINDIYLNIFQVTQKEVGRLWQMGKIFVAQEHFITAATQFIMSYFYKFMFSTPKQNKSIFIACINGELHEMGPRMIADLFELNGWDTYYFGANTPQSSLINAIETYKPKIISISATMTYNISSVKELITKIRIDKRFDDIKIMVGGYPFTLSNNLWSTVGADAFSADFDTALLLANSFYNN
jgi:methanogenic corrinoid protein MtbC1